MASSVVSPVVSRFKTVNKSKSSKNVNVSEELTKLSVLIPPIKKNDSITQDDFSAEHKKEKSLSNSALPLERKENTSNGSPIKHGTPSKKLTLNRTTSTLKVSPIKQKQKNMLLKMSNKRGV